MIRGIAVTVDRKPSFAFCRDWSVAMAAKKAFDPTFEVIPLPHWLAIVDDEGLPTPQFVQLTRKFTPPIAQQAFADKQGRPTDYALSWWKTKA